MGSDGLTVSQRDQACVLLPADLLVVNPPRAGLGSEVSDALLATPASRIIYVSCDPSTLARDAGRLSEIGYRLDTCQPVDMFPQTYHVETIALFTKASE